MRALEADELRVQIHGQHALTLSVATERETSINHGDAWSALSVAWESAPDAFETALWIDDCLPENGERDAYNARAGTATGEHGVKGPPTRQRSSRGRTRTWNTRVQ